MPHFYERNIVEIKNEYTTFLTNIMTPLVYEGIKAVYDKAKKLEEQFLEKEKVNPEVKNPGIFKIFQACLRDIPNLNNYSIEVETNRIKEKSKCSDIFEDLIKAVIKSNIILLTYNASGKKCKLVNEKYHETIDIQSFIHKVYIECAKTFYNNPELFWHKFSTIEIKKNQRESHELIRNCIIEAIRKMLPVKLILEEYLKNDYIEEPESEKKHSEIKSMLNKDIKILDSQENSFEEYDDVNNHSSEYSENEFTTQKKLSESRIMDEDKDSEKITSEINNLDDLVLGNNTANTEVVLSTSKPEPENKKDKGVKQVFINIDGNKKNSNFIKDQLQNYNPPQIKNKSIDINVGNDEEKEVKIDNYALTSQKQDEKSEVNINYVKEKI